MLRKILILTLLLLLALLIPACSMGGEESAQTGPANMPAPTATVTSTPTAPPPKPEVGYTPVPADAPAPAVIQHSPPRGASLPPDGAVELVFDREMDRQSVEQAFRLQMAGEDPAPVDGDLLWVNNRTAQFQPNAPLTRAATYDAILTQDAVADTGDPLREPYTFRFSTQGYLEVAQVMPAPGAEDIESNATITVIFNRPVVPLTTLSEMENLPEPLSFEPKLEGKGEWLNTSIYVFAPAEDLIGGVTYTAKVSAGLQGIGGEALAEDYTWQFSIIPPKVLWQTPPDGQTLVDIKTPVTIEFNQPVDPASAQNAFSMEGSGLLSKNIKGNFSVKSHTLIFTPTQALDFDTTYTVRLNAGVIAAGGVNLPAEQVRGMKDSLQWRFTTVPLPKIASTFPENGERHARPFTDFRITFNAPINPATVMPNIQMTPPLSPTQVYTYFSQYDNTFVINFGAEPSTDYKVVIGSGISDPYGNTIPKGRAVNFRTDSLPPTFQLRIPDFIATYDAALPARVVVGHVNIHTLNLSLHQLPADLLQREQWEWYDYQPDKNQLIRQWKQNLEAPLNKQSYTAIDVNQGQNLQPGIYLLDVDSPDLPKDYDHSQRHILVVSDLNLTLKTGPSEALVWATNLADGRPVPKLNLNIYADGDPLPPLTTGGDGIVRLNTSERRGNIVVYSASPFAAIAEGWGRGISVWDFGLSSGENEQDFRAYLYTDRPIYRPEQSVYFKGAIRAEDDAAYRLPDIGKVTLAIRDAAYEEIYRETLPVSEVGTFNGSVELAEGASLGTYLISVEYAGRYAEQPFQVAAYRPPEFQISVAPAADEIQRGDDLNADIEVSYFFGGGLANTNVEWNVIEESCRFKPPWGGRYSFSDVDDPYACFDCWWWYQPDTQEAILSGTGVTDAEGKLSLNISGGELKNALTHHASRITIEASATGPDNQFIAGRGSVIVHPGSYYIGLASQKYVGKAGQESKIDLAAVDWEGNRLPDKGIKVEFYRREWLNTFVENEFGGGYWEWETKETLIDEVIAASDELGEAVAAFTPSEGGSYHIVAAPAEATSAEKHIRSSIFIWVSGENYVSWRRNNNDRITLVSDKSSYKVGETAEILIPAPFDGPYYALITTERAGIRRHEALALNNNSAIYRLPITEGDIPNIYVSVALVKGRADGNPAEFKMGLLPLDVNLEPKTLVLKIEADTAQAEPGQEVKYTITAQTPDGSPAAGAELSVDVVDKAVLSLQPRGADILSAFYSRRALQINTASGLSVSANRYLKELAEDLEMNFEQGVALDGMGGGPVEGEMLAEAAPMPAAPPMAKAMATMPAEAAREAPNIAPPEGVEIREEFSDTAFWTPGVVTDEAGKASVSVTLPDNLTTWVVRGVGLTAETIVGEETSDLLATKPLLIRPVAPRFFVVDDRAQLAANVNNNTDEDLEVEVSLSAEGVGISSDTPPLQSVTIPARSEAKVTWWATVDDVISTTLIFAAVSGDYADASKPRLTTGPDGSLLVFRYTAPDIAGAAGQLTEGGSRTEAIALPPQFDDRRGSLTVQLDPGLAAGMQDSLDYLEHYEYECTEQTVSRFLPNVLTYNALKSLGVENPELEAKLPALLDEGLNKLYRQQNPDGGWGWWYNTQNPRSNPHVSGYVVFALLKARQAGIGVSSAVLENGINYLKTQLISPNDYKNYRSANQQAWLLYVLAEGKAADPTDLHALFENREKLSYYARACLAQALWLGNKNDARLATLLSDLNNAAILSATGAHWEEDAHDWWAMNTDTRSTAIILDTLSKLDPDNALNPNVVRWLMVARRGGVWESTQESAWALIALTDWMVMTGELDANYDYSAALNSAEILSGHAERETIQEGQKTVIPIANLLADTLNTLTISRSDGPGRLYYSAHLKVYLPVEEIEAADRGIIVNRRYTLASCEDGPKCPEVREAKLGDVIRVDLTIIAPNDLYYVVVEDPLPAGGEAIDTGLATTSLLAMDPTLRRQSSPYWWWWRWYSRSELRDEKVVLFADYLSKGTYEYSYTFRATLPGDYHVIPTLAQEFYFPEVFGRSDGRLLSIGE